MKLLLRYLCCPLLAAWLLIAASVTIAADTFAPVAESELIAVLQSGQPADKALACKKLALYGGKDSAPELAKLLGDEQLASWARIALEAISDPAAGDALRGALSTLKGKLAIGTIHSIGIRKDTASIDALVARLQDTDADVAGACALALGRIGGAVANKTLRQSLQSGPAAIRSMVAEGCILCAERCLAENKHAESVAIYDEVRAADVPKPRKLEATRGAILARKTDGIPLLIEQLRSTDKKFFQIGLNTARELPGKEVADALAAELGRTLPNRAALVLYALAGRKDAAISPAVLAAAKSADPHMQIAAVGLIGRAGDAASLPVLLEIAADPATNAELAAATKEAITTLPGDTINRELAALLPKADAKTLPILIQSIGERRIEATPALVAALNNPDSSIRTAALTALGETIAAKDLPLLIAQVLSPANADDAPAANKALHAASVRMPDREACAAALASAVDRAPAPVKVTIIEILGAVGGPKALQTIAAAMQGGEEALSDTGSRALGEWMTADAAPVLLKQATANAGAGNKYQVRALRGYIRIARQFQMPIADRAAMCQKALEAAGRSDEQKLTLAILERYPSIETLKVACNATHNPALKEDATMAALAIVAKLGPDSSEARQVLAEFKIEPPNVAIIKAEYGAGRKQQDVTDVLRKQLKGAPAIALSAGTYNESFGGDPVPGSAKQLKIQYQLNGKSGEVVFAENQPIVLPALN